MPKVLVHLHLYYPEQLEYMLNQLKKINACEWVLYVTSPQRDVSIEKRIYDIKKEAIFLYVNNVGYDVWPFIQVIKQVNLSDYDYILKIHTKNARDGDYQWRNRLIDALLGSKFNFRRNMTILNKHPEIGMIGDKYCLHSINGDAPEDKDMLSDFMKKINLPDLKNKACVFGTMFIVRSAILKKIQEYPFDEKDFHTANYSTDSKASLAHVLERIFGILALSCGYKIHGKQNKLLNFHKKLCSIERFNKKTVYRLCGFKLVLRKKSPE